MRTILPLSIITCTSMLAMDLYLPAVPGLEKTLDANVTLAQATVAIFLLGLAASQLLWGEVLSRAGPRRCVQVGVGLLVVSSVACALAPSVYWLLAMRLIQGVAAGVATVVAPTVVRATLSDAHAVRGIAAISMVESIVPAVGPVLGAALLLYMDWRGLFWILSATALLALPLAIQATPRHLPGLDRTIDASYRRILSNRKYRRLALSHALSVGTLLTFVASAPQLMINALELGASAFPLLQIIGVAGFFVMATQSGRISQRIGPARAVQLGAWIQAWLCLLLLLACLMVDPSFALVALFWCCFCGALAIRGPPGFMEALSLPPAQIGRASAMLVLALLFAGALGTQLLAPYMAGHSAAPLGAAMLVGALISLALVSPYPHDAAESIPATPKT